MNKDTKRGTDAAPTASAPSGEALTYSDYFVWITSQGKPAMSPAAFDRLMAEEAAAQSKQVEASAPAIGQQADSGPVIDVWVDPNTKQRSLLDHGTPLAPFDKREFVGSLVWSTDPQDDPVNPENLKLRAALAQPVEVKGAADINWSEAQRICDLPAVDEAIRGLLEDQTGDNATGLVREILRAAHLSATNSGTEGVDTDDCAAFSDAVLFGTAPAPQAAPDDLLGLLREFVNYTSDSAGMTVEIVEDTEKFTAFMAELHRRRDSLISRAKAAIAQRGAA